MNEIEMAQHIVDEFGSGGKVIGVDLYTGTLTSTIFISGKKPVTVNGKLATDLRTAAEE